MKTLSLTLLLALICSFGFGQTDKQIYSLKQKLSQTEQDSNRVLLLVDLCEIYRPINQDSLHFYGQKALNLAKSIQFPKGEVRALAIMGRGQVQVGNLPKALEMELRSLQIAEDNNLKTETALSLNYIGTIHYFLNDFSNSLFYYKASKSAYELTHDSERIAIENMNIGSAYEDLNKLDSALYFDKLAYDYMSQSKSGVRPMLFRNIGEVYIKLNKYELALGFIRKGLEKSLKHGTRQVSCTCYNSMARVFKNLNKLDSSIYFAQKALSEGQSINYRNGILESALLLSELFEQKDSKTALNYYKLASIAKDSLYGNGIVQAISTITAQERERQIEKDNTKKAHQNQLKQYFLLSILGVFLFIAFILYRNNQKEKKAKTILQEKNQEIQSTLSTLKATQNQLIQSEKLASLGELTAGIAHEIQNPLNFVNNFAELSVGLAQELKEEINKVEIHEKDKEYIDEILTDLSENQEKINLHGKRASSIVTGMLEHSRASTGERVLTDINKLADESLRLSYHGLRAKDKNFNSDFELITDPNLPKINVIPQDIGRVLINLINNAFQSSPQTPDGGLKKALKVVVTTKFLAPPSGAGGAVGMLIVRVTDNGTGMSEATKAKIFQPFFTTKPTGQGTGLGLSLAYDIITKGHGGTIECESVEGEGTTFVVKLPL